MTDQKQHFTNPINKEKTTDTPHLLPYAHQVGSALVRPIDKGKIKGLALAAMYQQTNLQLDQIREQVELLMQQAQAIHRRVEISEKIYRAEMNFKPLIGHVYHLYTRPDSTEFLSMIAPEEWGRKAPAKFRSSVKLLADHTWEIIRHADEDAP